MHLNRTNDLYQLHAIYVMKTICIIEIRYYSYLLSSIAVALTLATYMYIAHKK